MARKPQDNPQLDMTPMIDVVFELIIFFVVTIKQEDLFSKLNVNRPAPNPAKPEETNDITVNIELGNAKRNNPNGVIVYNKREVSRQELDKNLAEIASTSKKTPIIIKCQLESPHKVLVDVLDICYKHDLYSVSVFTL
ncbi:MAG: biopolymer transporter ExbD [Kiritimatiellae bacterium]|jgi:biopolymer transport protein ExbD|nr:biopolymer transporter ExbD [Kiritimatiellia bacterium]